MFSSSSSLARSGETGGAEVAADRVHGARWNRECRLFRDGFKAVTVSVPSILRVTFLHARQRRDFRQPEQRMQGDPNGWRIAQAGERATVRCQRCREIACRRGGSERGECFGGSCSAAPGGGPRAAGALPTGKLHAWAPEWAAAGWLAAAWSPWHTRQGPRVAASCRGCHELIYFRCQPLGGGRWKIPCVRLHSGTFRIRDSRVVP